MKETLLDIQLLQEKGSPSLPELAAVLERRMAARADRQQYLGELGMFLASCLDGVVPDPESYT